MEVKPVFASPQIQFNRAPSSTAVAADDKSKGISYETSAIDCESIAFAVVSDVNHLSPSKRICHFSCKECHDLAKEPVINVICGHLFCWSCLCRRLTPPDPKRRGFLRGCPFCKSHLDISPAMSTVLPVYSGPEPGVELFSPIHNPEPEPDEEEERKREETIRKEGKLYVAPRPAWQTRSQYTTTINFIVDMLSKICDTRVDMKYHLEEGMEDTASFDSDILYEQNQIAELLQELKAGWLWLTGDEYPRQPEKTKDGRFDVVLDPTDTKLTDISTFACRICNETAFEPVVTTCGHLFCWTCLWNEISCLSNCPICDMHVNLFASRVNINSIYCEPNDPCKEDESLKSSRKALKQEIPAPCRPRQYVATSFLDNMIKKVTKVGNEIMKQLLNLKSSSPALLPKQIREAYLEVIKVWDMFYADLLIEWRKSTREEVKESQIQPILLDFISNPRVIRKVDYGILIEGSGYYSDFIGDRMIN